jgi:hypothetical protein
MATKGATDEFALIRATAVKAIEATRNGIADLRREIAHAKNAPMKIASQREALLSYLAQRAQWAGPKVSFAADGSARIAFRESMVVDKNDLLAVLAYFFGPQRIAAAFFGDAEAGRDPEPEGALSPSEREQAVSRFTNTLLTLERQEEFLIEKAAAEGTEITRRPEASPMAVLGLVIAAKEPATQAA